jgi:hypothetical protein
MSSAAAGSTPPSTIGDGGAESPFEVGKCSDAIRANAFYFSNREWAAEYLEFCHRSVHFKERWRAASGDWTGKIVVDLGCRPSTSSPRSADSPSD